MKNLMRRAMFLLLLVNGVLFSAEKGIELVEPVNGFQTIHPHPHFAWSDLANTKNYRIQIASDNQFKVIVDEDLLPWQISRYVPAKALPLGRFYWRVMSLEESGAVKQTSPIFSFDRYRPSNVISVPPQATYSEIQGLVKQAVAITPAVLEFEPNATYNLKVKASDSLFNLEGAKDLLIDGKGALFMFDVSESQTGFVMSSKSEEITIQDCKIDYTPEAINVLDVLEVGSPGQGFVVKDRPGAIPFNEKRITNPNKESDEEEQRDSTEETDSKDDIGMGGYIKRKEESWRFLLNAPNQFRIDLDRVKVLESGKFRFFAKEPNFESRIQVGDVYALYDGIYPGGRRHNFKIEDSNNIVFSGIINRSIINGHAIGWGNHRIAFLGCESRCAEGKFHSDGQLLMGGIYGPWIENCVFEGGVDDTLNSRGVGYAVSDIQGASFKYFQRGLSQESFKIGDEIVMMQGFKIYAHSKIESINRKEDKKNTLYTITLDRKIDSTPPNKKARIFNHTRNNTQYVVRNCTFNTTRRNAIIMTANRALFENNLFYRVGQGSIAISKSSGGGVLASDIVIRNNRFESCGWMTGGGAVTSLFRGFKGQYYRDIEIDKNEFFGFRDRPIDISNAKNVTIRQNLCYNGEWNAMPESIPFTSASPEKANAARSIVALLDAAMCDGVKFIGNRIFENRARTLTLNSSESKNVIVPEEKSIVINPWRVMNSMSKNDIQCEIGNLNPVDLNYSRFLIQAQGKFSSDALVGRPGLIGIQLHDRERITAKLLEVEGGYAGMILCDSDSPNSPFVALVADGKGVLKTVYRLKEKGPLETHSFNVETFPLWLRVEAHEGEVHFWYSKNQEKWVKIDSLSLYQANLAVAGLTAFKWDTTGTTPTKAKFDPVDTLKKYFRWSFQEASVYDQKVDRFPFGEVRIEKGEALNLSGNISRVFPIHFELSEKTEFRFNLNVKRRGSLSLKFLSSKTKQESSISISIPDDLEENSLINVEGSIGAKEKRMIDQVVIEQKKEGKLFPEMTISDFEILEEKGG